MSIHTVTEETTVTSDVEVLAPAGERTEAVARAAHAEVDRVCKLKGLHDLPTDVFVSQPVYKEGRRWLVRITKVFRTSEMVSLED